MNVVLIVIDSLRKDHLGVYGNNRILTPNLDEFANESAVFSRCYPESLPTLQVRRALHTGMRVFPFHGHQDFKGGFKGAAGWRPILEERDTVAEILKEKGYRTAIITDTYHQFKPSMNFHRGFDEWQWIRGQEADPYKSGPLVPEEKIASHMKEKPEENPRLATFLRNYLRNNAYQVTEKDYFPAKVFSEASRWVLDNNDAKKFFLVVDSFDPHEPWDPPVHYRRMYDPREDVTDLIQSLYAPWKGYLTPREVKRIQANYAGEVTMVDRWFGTFLETLRCADTLKDTVIAVISDHGHNLGIDPCDKGLISKQGHPMTHAVADLVLMVRHPEGEGAGTLCDKLVYNIDLTSTLMQMIDIKPRQKMDGIDFWPAAISKDTETRDYVTVAWGPLVTVIDDNWWFNANVWGDASLLYDVGEDPHLERNLAEEQPEMCRKMLSRAIKDAGGEIPKAFEHYTEKPSCTPYWSSLTRSRK